MDLSGTDNQKQPISDDQELAKALAGVTDMQFEETGASPVATPAPVDPGVSTINPAIDPAAEPVAQDTPLPEPAETIQMPQPSTLDSSLDSGLAEVKQAAITELRPLIDKLDVEPEEKFNTYLLLIRSTDDKDLVAPAHEAAKNIVDEAKKAQALLDIIKEIDFLSNPKQ